MGSYIQERIAPLSITKIDPRYRDKGLMFNVGVVHRNTPAFFTTKQGCELGYIEPLCGRPLAFFSLNERYRYCLIRLFPRLRSPSRRGSAPKDRLRVGLPPKMDALETRGLGRSVGVRPAVGRALRSVLVAPASELSRDPLIGGTSTQH